VNSLTDALKYIVELNGTDCLRNGDLCVNMLKDVIPGLKKEQVIFEYFVRCQGNIQLLDAGNKSEADLRILEKRIVARMEDDFFAPKEMSEMVCASFLTALGRTPVIARTKDPAEREQILDQLYDNYTKDIFEAVEALGIKMKSCVELKNMDTETLARILKKTRENNS